MSLYCWLCPSSKGLPLPSKDKDSPITRGLQMSLFRVCLCPKMTIRIGGWDRSCCVNYQRHSSWGIDCAMGSIISPGFSKAKTVCWLPMAAPAPSPLGKTPWYFIAWHGERLHRGQGKGVWICIFLLGQTLTQGYKAHEDSVVLKKRKEKRKGWKCSIMQHHSVSECKLRIAWL